jgi:hypothetical protein
VKFIVTGWKAGKTYREETSGLAGAQIYCDDAHEKGFFNIKAVNEEGKSYTRAQIDEIVGNPPKNDGNKDA